MTLGQKMGFTYSTMLLSSQGAPGAEFVSKSVTMTIQTRQAKDLLLKHETYLVGDVSVDTDTAQPVCEFSTTVSLTACNRQTT